MCAFVFYMSALPADDSNAISTGVIWRIVGFIVPGYDQLPAAEQLQWQEALQNPVRKTAHFLEYALLGALMLNLVLQSVKARRSGKGRPNGTSSLGTAPDSTAQTSSPGASCAPQTSSPIAARIPRNSMPNVGRAPLHAWALTTAYAATDELHQLFVPGRTGRIIDVGIDAAGALLGIALLLLALRLMHRN